MFRPVHTSVVGVVLIIAIGCSQEMANQRRVESQEATAVFADGTASRPTPEHTIAASASARQAISTSQTQPSRNWLDVKNEFDDGGDVSGEVDGSLVSELPKRVFEGLDYSQILRRGRERFNISCAPCHDLTGSGNGMVARRGLKFPPSYHTDRLRNQSIGYIFNVATNGHGQMPDYGDYLSTDDRWAIAGYVRTLQLSQYFPASELTSKDIAKFASHKDDKGEVESP